MNRNRLTRKTGMTLVSGGWMESENLPLESIQIGSAHAKASERKAPPS